MNLLRAVKAHYTMTSALDARGHVRRLGISKGLRMVLVSGVAIDDFAHMGNGCDSILDGVGKTVSPIPAKKRLNNRFSTLRANRRDCYSGVRMLSHADAVRRMLVALRALKRRIR